MKTLKKSLCLVLALVMVLGFGAISASADLDYEDTKDITYAEAVDVMSGIGVLEGYEDGTFLPTKEVSREEAAKIIAYLMVGSSSEADALSTTADPFEDVSKDRWSAGYIAYLVQKGVINGVGEGKFDPTGKVTGLQFAKMLLTALGYGVNSEYVGETWAINVAKDALQYGIFTDNLGGANNTPATREECALYAFNTLWLKKVTYSALLGGYIENIGYGYWTSGDPNNAESNKTNTFANDFGLWIDPTEDDAFERPTGYEYKVGRRAITATYGADEYLVGSYTTPVTGNVIYNLLGSSIVRAVNNSDKYYASLYVDGAEIENADDMFAANVVKSNLEDLEYTGYGVETYVYVIPYDYQGETYYEVRTCIINTLLAEVVDVTAATKTKDAKTVVEVADVVDDDRNTSDEYKHLVDLSNEIKSFETEDYSEGELVLVTCSLKSGFEGIQSMDAATLTEAKITKYTNKGVAKITAGGETYTGAKNDYVLEGQSASQINEKQVKNKEYTLILDQYGYIIGITEEAVVTDYVYVSQFGQKIDTTGDLSDYTTLSAKVWYADPESKTGASSKIVLVDIDSGDIKHAAKEFNIKSFDGNYDKLIAGLNNYWLGLYTIKMSGGKATLTRQLLSDTFYDEVHQSLNDPTSCCKVTDKVDFTEGIKNNQRITKGISRLSTGYYATTNTTFFYVTGKYPTETVSVYTGINKIPVSDTNFGTKGTGVAVGVEGYIDNKATSDGNNIFDAILVNWTPAKTEEKSDVYFYLGNYTKEGPDADGNYTVTFEVMKNGVESVITYTYSDEEAADEAIATASDNELKYVKALGKTLTSKDIGSGYVDVVNSPDYAVINEIHKIGDIYETTLYIDDNSENTPYYMENAKVIDLRPGEDVSTMRGLQKLAAEVELDANDDVIKTTKVQVAFEYNTKTLEITTIYIIDSELVDVA